MALSIRNPRAEKLAREVAAESKESLTQAIIHALEDRLERLIPSCVQEWAGINPALRNNRAIMP